MALDKPKIKVLDTHIHLAVDWKESLGGGKGLPNVWLPGEPDSFQRNFTEKNLLDLNAEGPHNFEIVGTVFVECSNVPAEEEARWTLSMAEDPGSSVKAVVANIPVPNGAAAVRTFLDKLRNKNDGSLPSRLKGGRVVLLGDPMPPPNLCLSDSYLEGLCELQKTGLIWEWCCVPEAIPHITTACEKFPDMTFILDHLGHNSGGDDFQTWAPAIADLAKRCPNVYAKLGAIEQWDCKDPGPEIYLDHALKVFGYDRVLAESNWFVSTAMGFTYDDTFQKVLEALQRSNATATEVQAVFEGNARRVYGITD